MEHLGEVPWQYRWRIIGDYPAPYLVWREKTTRAKFAIIHSEIRDCQIEVEWREVVEEVESGELSVESQIEDEESISSSSPSTLNPQLSTPPPWLPVSLILLTPGTARFTVTAAAAAFSAPQGFTAVAPVRDHGVAAWHFPPMELAPGETLEVTATADAPVIANLLLEPGEFRPVIPGLTITNLTPAEDAFTEAAHSGPFQLARCPITAGRRLFAYGLESVDPALLSPVKQD